MKLSKITYLFIGILLVFGFNKIHLAFDSDQSIEVVSLQHKIDYIAGEEIILNFTLNQSIEVDLLLESSYATTLIKSQPNEENLTFNIPSFISEKKGVLYYKLLNHGHILYSGKLIIKSDKNIKSPLESYLGPTSIISGGTDYGMLTVLPSDKYDNPIEDRTLVSIRHQFLENENNSELYTEDFIAWQNIYSNNKSGRILISAYAGQTASKEFTIDVFPAQAQDFELFASRKHEYADGNQIITFSTSEIKDNFGNTVSDGRFVEFSILTDQQEKIRTTGTTINGVAKGYIVHPSKETIWNVQAFIPEMAESNILTLDFKASVKDYKVEFDRINRNISVGPILSFMNQIIPDGALISLSVIKNGKSIDTFSRFSSEGFVTFTLLEDFFPNGIYTLEIEGMGIKKAYTNIKLQ